ncbi:MAG: Coenzyme F420 hydrogenase/dehydrogenase, beta subunit C-terminal domain [Ruminococcus sp.]
MSISKIVNDSKCVSCGLCNSVCPVNAITLKYIPKKGVYEPDIDTAKCINCDKCEKLCPTNTERSKSLLGPFISGYLAHAKNQKIREDSTSGGIINRLVEFLIAGEYVEAVVMVEHDVDSPIEASAKIITKKEVQNLGEIPREYASRYVVVPVLENLIEMFTKYKKIAVVGTPCQIRAVNKLNIPNDVEIFKIGITCSGGMRYIATEEYKRMSGLENAKMYYRGKGWPGKNSLVTDEKCVEYGHQGSLFERMFSSQIFKIKGCRHCSDHYAECADISFCDFWNSQEMKKEHLGNSCVIIRSRKAESIFNELIRSGRAEIVRQLNIDEIIATQISVLKAKKGNMSTKLKYKLFIKLVDFTFKCKIYKIFNYKIYCKLASIYLKMCRASKLDENLSKSVTVSQKG